MKKFFQSIAEFLRKHEWFPKRDHKKYNSAKGSGTVGPPVCTHEKAVGSFIVNVRGTECQFSDSLSTCPNCMREYLERVTTLCASCRTPIFPGMLVGLARQGAPHPLTHLSFGCCPSGALYCGRWGEGRLRTLHELEPDCYPDGTTSVLAHAFRTGDPIMVHFE